MMMMMMTEQQKALMLEELIPLALSCMTTVCMELREKEPARAVLSFLRCTVCGQLLSRDGAGDGERGTSSLQRILLAGDDVHGQPAPGR